MFKVAILGIENSHANIFAHQINSGAYPGVEIVGAYSDETEILENYCKNYSVPLMKTFDELAGNVDGVIITARHGANHYKYAKPYIPYKIPIFIDKPIACTDEEALAFMRELKQNGAPAFGGSMCKHSKETVKCAQMVKENTLGDIEGGNLLFPIDMNNPYGGFSFYAQHLIEVMLVVFGYDVKEVNASMREDRLSFIARYDQYDVTGTYTVHESYQISVYGKDEVVTKNLTLGGHAFMDRMYSLLNGEDVAEDYDTLIKPIFVMNALLRSAKSGKWEPVNAEQV